MQGGAAERCSSDGDDTQNFNQQGSWFVPGQSRNGPTEKPEAKGMEDDGGGDDRQAP